ncbi:hypothetical protein RB653_009356 [Dictyostelium firmibasis]|uniref:Saposin B-type domain-containing protein n=1 Tax=Dictyostelium firmibasis TaxID=79012 RepID=A0AAN7U1W9_9MYCE
MRFFATLFLIIAILINSCMGSLSILALKHQCNSYCSQAGNYAQDLAKDALGSQHINIGQAQNDFKNSFPQHFEKLVEIKDYLQSCEHACDSLVQNEIFNFFN